MKKRRENKKRRYKRREKIMLIRSLVLAVPLADDDWRDIDVSKELKSINLYLLLLQKLIPKFLLC